MPVAWSDGPPRNDFNGKSLAAGHRPAGTQAAGRADCTAWQQGGRLRRAADAANSSQSSREIGMAGICIVAVKYPVGRCPTSSDFHVFGLA